MELIASLYWLNMGTLCVFRLIQNVTTHFLIIDFPVWRKNRCSWSYTAANSPLFKLFVQHSMSSDHVAEISYLSALMLPNVGTKIQKNLAVFRGSRPISIFWGVFLILRWAHTKYLSENKIVILQRLYLYLFKIVTLYPGRNWMF